MRWTLLTALANAGAVAEAEVDAERDRDNTATGRERAARALAAMPTEAMKAAAWREAIEKDGLPNSVVEAIGIGFGRPSDPDLLRPYVARYHDMLEPMWASRTHAIGEAIVVSFYPRSLADRDLLDATQALARRARRLRARPGPAGRREPGCRRPGPRRSGPGRPGLTMTAADLDLLRQLTWHDVGSWFLGDGLRIVLTLVIAWVVRFLGHRAISRVVRAATSKGLTSVVTSTRAGHVLQAATEQTRQRHIARTRTMGALLRSIVTFLVGTIALLTVLALIGIPLAPLLASAGVGGVALGFGAQSLVKDFLSGIFMILEDQYGVGDVIDAGEVVGTVEDVPCGSPRCGTPTG